MSSLLRSLAAVICLALVQGPLYVLFFMRPSSVVELRSEVESRNGVGTISSDVKEDMKWYNRNSSEWQADVDIEKQKRFEEEVNRDLLDMKVKIKSLIEGTELWMRNTNKFLELLRHWVDSESKSNQKKFINDSIGKTRFDSSSQVNAESEPIKPLEEYSLTKRNESTVVQTGFIENFRYKIPVNRSRARVIYRPLSPLEQYYLTVRTKRKEIREGPIVNPLNFSYIINPGYNICAGQKVFLIAFVPTSVDHYGFRRVIRKTWAVTSDFRLPVRCVFIVGRSSAGNAFRIQQLVELESRKFGDIVQADFLDTYNNLTYRSLVGLRWAATYCHEAKYVLKIDDDTYVNMFALLDRLEQELNYRTFSNLKILCRVIFHDEVHRTGKWSVNESEFRLTYYPPYCSGPAYVLTMTMASQVVRDSLRVPFFHFEDVYVTGFVTLMSGDNVRFVQWDSKFDYLGDFPRVFITRDRNKYMFAAQISNNFLYTNVWQQMRQLYINSRQQTLDSKRRTPK